MKRWLIVLLGLWTTGVFAQTPGAIEGSVTAVLMDHLQLKTVEGAKLAIVPPGTVVTRRTVIAWSEIQPGEWVGVDSKPGADGTQDSVAINVFSPSMVNKVRKGQFPMVSGDLMTNAPVEQISQGAQGVGLVLKNADAMVPFRVTEKTEVHRLVDASLSDLKPGTHVTVRGTINADGSVQATFVSITP